MVNKRDRLLHGRGANKRHGNDLRTVQGIGAPQAQTDTLFFVPGESGGEEGRKQKETGVILK